MLINIRKQQPVGQGFFHSSVLLEEHEPRLRYVYDCGSMFAYTRPREERIDELLKEFGAGSRLELLFISHVHADHVNGVERLLDRTKGLAVDTIVLPLVNAVDRLIAYARTASDDAASAADAFYRAFIVDPAGAVSRFDPRQILFVEPGDRNDGAPAGGGDSPSDPPARDTGRAKITGPEGERGLSWRLIGFGEVRANDPRVASPAAESPLVAVIPDTMGFETDHSTGSGQWLLAPFVDPGIVADRELFLDELARLRGVSRTDLDASLTDTAELEDLIVNAVDDLAQAYCALAKNLNITSMSLYSGPQPGSSQAAQHFHQIHFGNFSADGGRRSIAWLATGDAALREGGRRSDFLLHYRKLLEEVVTFTLPHHGSDNNFHEDLLDKVAPTFCIAAAEKFAKWKHPGHHVVQSVASRGLMLSVVTSKPASRVAEMAAIN